MGTRSLTHFKATKDSKTLATMYKQFDGYPDGLGKEYYDFLAGKKLVNGLSGDRSTVFNGMGCLAASVIAHMKEAAGNVYMYEPDASDCWEEYTYVIYGPDAKVDLGEDAEIFMEVYASYSDTPDKAIFSGKISEYAHWLEEYQKREEEE